MVSRSHSFEALALFGWEGEGADGTEDSDGRYRGNVAPQVVGRAQRVRRSHQPTKELEKPCSVTHDAGFASGGGQ